MKRILLLLLAAAGMLMADATGKWTGTLTVSTPDGERPSSAYLVLKQDGTTLTGTAGRNAEEQNAIQNGKVENGKLTFELPIGEATMKFALEQKGEVIEGDVSAEAQGQKLTARLSVKLEK